MDEIQLASIIDHTLLHPESSDADVRRVCEEARSLGTAAVCVNLSRLAQVVRMLDGSGIQACSVIAFPFGVQSVASMTDEIRDALECGAQELDMVAPLSLAADARYDAFRDVLQAARQAAGSTTLKVILETAIWTQDVIEILCDQAVESGADFVKTSTGFHPRGGATPEIVALLAQRTQGSVGIKASGGIRTWATAKQMLDAGATRLGCSATVAVLEGFAQETGGREAVPLP